MRLPHTTRGWTLERKVKHYTQETPTCWIWMGPLLVQGHGHLCYRGKTLTAHRASWMVHRGPIPDGMHVLHTCDNRICVRPDHLYVGTRLDNARDMVTRNHHRGNLVLNEETVRIMREEAATTKYSLAMICWSHGVHEVTGYHAIRGRTWKHLPMAVPRHQIGGDR